MKCVLIFGKQTTDWEVENTDLTSGNTHLWEESWDDDDTNDDFSAQLRLVSF